MAPTPEEFDPKTLEQKEDEINEILHSKNDNVDKISAADAKFDGPLVWRNVIIFIFLHTGALYGIYLVPSAKAATNAFGKHLFEPSI